MRVRKLAPGNDYSFGNQQQDFWRDVPEAVAQVASTRLLLWSGEWFLDVTEGTPFITGIFGKKTKDEADFTIQQRVEGTQGLTRIQNYESGIDQETRKMSAQFDIDTIFGPTDLEVANFVNF